MCAASPLMMGEMSEVLVLPRGDLFTDVHDMYLVSYLMQVSHPSLQGRAFER